MNIYSVQSSDIYFGIPTNNKDPSEKSLNVQNKMDKKTNENSQPPTSNKPNEETKSSENKDGKLSLSKNNKSDPKKEQEIQKLKRIDAHVKAHEQAHIAAGGPYVRGGPQYSYVIGPDGNRYAVAGEVKIDVSPVPGNPDATIRKAQVIKRAALAPSDPSPQDRAVAAKADQMALKAKIEKYRKQVEEMKKLVEKNDHPANMISPSFDENSSPSLTDIIQPVTSTLKKSNIKFKYGSNNYIHSIIHKIA